MTAEPVDQPEPPLRGPARLLTVADYVALGETEPGYTELLEGRLLMSPSPIPKHGRVSLRLAMAISAALPTGYEVLQDIDLDLRLAPPGGPGFVRRPDLMVVRGESVRRVDEHGGLLLASDAVLVVEIVSPGSQRTDRVDKRIDYADAGIPYYWVIDVAEPVSLLTHHLAGDFGYADGGEVTGTFQTGQPFAFELELERLR